ncbi:MAG: caspase family protein, partial [Planctomyces sp.]
LLISGKPAENAKIIQQHLQQLENLGVRVGPAERAEILTTFIDLTAIATVSSQLLVCAFSSHGFNEDKIAYVMPQDGSRKLLSATAVPVDNLETSMTGSKAGHRLFFIDACQERVSAKGNNPVGNGASKLLIDALLKPTGQAKLVSCSPNQFSFENGSLGGVGHGVFTWHLLEALRGSAQPDAQNFIRLGAVSRYVSDGVQKWAQDNNRPLQTPKLECPEATRDLPLALRSSDLQTVIALLNARKTDDSFTAAFRDRLIQGLGKINPALESDQELLHNTQAFLRGDLSPRLFTRDAAGELDRILLARAPVAPVKPAPADAPMKPAAPGFAESLGLKFVSIPAGEFRMGSDETAEDLKKAGFVIPAGVDPGDESPARTVRMSAFRMQTTEVTRGQFAEFVRSTNYKTDAEKDGKGGYGFNAESGVFEQDPKYT